MNEKKLALRVLAQMSPDEFARAYAAEFVPLEVIQLLPDVMDALHKLGKDPLTIFERIISTANEPTI